MRRAAAAALIVWILAPLAGAALPAAAGTMGMECCIQKGVICECRVLAGITRCPESQSVTPPRFVPASLAPAARTLALQAGDSIPSLPRVEPVSFSRPPSTPPPRA